MVVLMLATGCNRIFGIDQTEVYDAAPPPPDAVGCAGKRFVGPDILTDFSSPVSVFEHDPNERFDQQELWFSQTEAGVQAADILVSTPRPTGGWNPGTPASFDLPGIDDYDPSLSGDGKRLVFISNRNGDPRIWEVTRADLAAPFAGAALVRGLDSYFVNGLDLTTDGLTLYFSESSGGDLHVAHRPTVDAPFVPEMEAGMLRVLATNVGFPSISPDDRELFYNHDGEPPIFRRVRADSTAVFEPVEETLYDSGDDPEISVDGKRLYFGDNGTLDVATRECP